MTGSASQVGVVPAPGTAGSSQIDIAFSFTFNGYINLATSSLRVNALLFETGGSGELVSGVPLTLTPDSGSSTPSAAFFVTPSGASPAYRFEVRNQDPQTSS